MWFEVIFGLKFNLDKSVLIPKEQVSNIEDLAWVVGCKVGFLPTTYLGLPLGLPLSLYKCGMQWRKDFRKDLLCERGSTYQKEGD